MRLRSLMSVAWMNRPSTLSPSRSGVYETMMCRRMPWASVSRVSNPAPAPRALASSSVCWKRLGPSRSRAHVHSCSFSSGTPNRSLGLVAQLVVEVHIPRADQRRDAVQDIAQRRARRAAVNALTALAAL